MSDEDNSDEYSSDEYSSSSSSSSGLNYYINEFTSLIMRVEENDPLFKKLSLPAHRRNCNYDWKRLGQAMRNNLHVKILEFDDFPSGLQHDTMFPEFCRGLADNRSIEELVLDCHLLEGMLSPFIEQNNNLANLHVAYCHVDNIPVLCETVSKSSSLKIFSIAERCMGGYLKDITLELTNHPRLTEIDYSKNKVDPRGVNAMATLLGSPRCIVTDLSLWNCSLNDETAPLLAGALENNRSLRRMSLAENPYVSITGWRSLIPHLSSFEEVRLWGNSIDNEAARLLANVLVNINRIQELNLATSLRISTAGWQSIFDALQHPNCTLKKLRLHSNRILEEDLVNLTRALVSERSCSLKGLDLSNISISNRGALLSTLLQSPFSNLEEVDIGDRFISDEEIVSIANSLVGNTKLKSLTLMPHRRTGSTWEDYFVRLLCNEATIIDTYNSNHTLQRIGNYVLPGKLGRLFRINQKCTPVEAARRKIIQVHFSGDISMEPFIDMDCEVFPHVIAWMARDGYGRSLVYQFLRNFTFMLDVSGVKQSESVSTRSSKRPRV